MCCRTFASGFEQLKDLKECEAHVIIVRLVQVQLMRYPFYFGSTCHHLSSLSLALCHWNGSILLRYSLTCRIPGF